MLARMSAMMFLQYWPLGTWGVTVGTYIAANTGTEGQQIFSSGFVGYSTAASAIGSLLSPVVVGFLSDRYFAAQHLVAVLHAACAVAAWRLCETTTQSEFFLWLVLFFQAFGPASSLTNKIALRHLADVDAEYPKVRLFGTVGWISAGLFIGFVAPLIFSGSIESTQKPMMIGALGNLLMAGYALTLPHSPPELRSDALLTTSLRDSRALFRNQALVMFLFVSGLACVPSMAYNNYSNLFLNLAHYPWPAALMTLGQISELVILTLTPALIARFGLRRLFMSGVAGWGLRYSLLALGSFYGFAWPVYGALLIHGVCYVFVYIIGVMYVDRLVHGGHRGAAQGLYSQATSGIGHLVGAVSVGTAQAAFLTPDGVSPPPYNWTAFWLIPAFFSISTLILFQTTFHPPRDDE
jgi:nucleoside transporter